MAQTATTEPRKIEFQLELSLEQYGIVKLLAKLQGTDLLAYIHQNLKDALPGLIDNIEDEKEREQARADYGDDYSSMGYERKILISCEYEASREQIKAISKIGAAYEQTPPELLSAAFLTVASGHLDQLNIFDTSKMKKTLEA